MTLMLLERRCPGCGRPWRSRGRTPFRGVCATCAAALVAAPVAAVAGVDRVVARWAYQSPASELIVAAKAGGRTDLLTAMGTELVRCIEPHLGFAPILTWVPASPAGRRRRGFDQGRSLAQVIGHRLGLPRQPAFTRRGDAQQGRSRSGRLEGPWLRLRPDWPLGPESARQVVIVDDVMTTGSSLAASAGALRARSPRIEILAAIVAVRG